MVSNHSKALYDYLLPYVTENKRRKFDQMLSQRTRALTIVLEDIFKPHNASAVLRTAECMGLQDVHIVEQENEFNLNPYVLRGSGKWLTVHHHRKENGVRQIETCIQRLKNDGYQILATTPDQNAVDYSDVEINKKTAVVFGAEENGVSQYIMDNADQLIKIPMMGFTESFNISVSAAIILENYQYKIRENMDWQLSKKEIQKLKLAWMQKSVPRVDVHLRQFEKLKKQQITK